MKQGDSPQKGILFPMSFAQQRLWFLDRLENGTSSAYNLPFALAFTGEMNREALDQSIQVLIDRHEILRTTFRSVKGDPVQVIHETGTCTLEIQEWQETDAQAQLDQVHALAKAQAETPFDLSKGPLIRAALHCFPGSYSVFLVTMHHIIADGWSLDIFVRELTHAYNQISQNKPLELPELDIQYGDYAEWQAEELNDAELNQRMVYWEKALAGAPPLLALPTDFSRGAAAAQMEESTSTLSLKLMEKVESFCRNHRITKLALLHSVLAVLFNRCSGQDDIVVGIPVANRTRREIEPLIGLFVNTVPLRTQIEGAESFTQLAQRVHTHLLGALEHQDMPFEKLVDGLNTERSLDHAPIFQVLVALQNTPLREFDLAGVSATPIDLKRPASEFDLMLAFVEKEGEMLARWNFNASLFRRENINRWQAAFLVLLEGMLNEPEKSLVSYSLVAPGVPPFEPQGSTLDHPPVIPLGTVPAMFEQAVSRTPAHIALEWGAEKLSYETLNARANQLADYLAAKGARPSEVVGIFMDRSVEMIIAILGVLKSGAAYVPLDPNYPEARLQAMLSDGKPLLVLTHAHLKDRLPETESKLCVWEEIAPELASRNQENVTHFTDVDAPLYLIYTSGSTGVPKGILLPHRAIENLVQWQIEEPEFASGLRTVQYTSLNFDVSIQEIISTFVSGGTLVLVDEATRTEPNDLFKYLNIHGIERIFLPFAGLLQLAYAAESEPGLTLQLKEVITAGEQLRVTPVIQSFFQRLGNEVVLTNQYGPSEAHVVSALVLKGEPESWPPLPSIGFPIRNCSLFMLDEHLHPVPAGIPGELCILGVPVALGYKGKEAETQLKFVKNPFQRSEYDPVIYRTGDRARYLENGEIEFLGRIGNQVKVRGFRVEPGEIESCLSKHEAVQQVKVIAKADSANVNFLVAFFTGSTELDPQELSAWVKAELPVYMVPDFFVQVPEMPLTPSGKLNQRALLALDISSAAPRDEYVAPKNMLEAQLVEVWGEILEREKIGINDNFFHLGGHSLKGIRLISLIHKRLKRKIELKNLFLYPTIRELAVVIDRTKESSLEEIIPAPIAEDYPLSYAQKRLWVLDQMEENSIAYNLPSAYWLEGKVEVSAMQKAFAAVLERHSVLRTRFTEKDGFPRQQIVPLEELGFALTKLDYRDQNIPLDSVQEALADLANVHFDLQNGPLIKADLVRLTDTRYLLFLTVHHIVFDGWSMNTLFHEMIELYKAFQQAKENPLSPLSIQYHDYAVWQEAQFNQNRFEAHQKYWHGQFEKGIPILEFPTNHPRPVVQTFQGKVLTVALDRAEFDVFKSFCAQAGTSSFITALALVNTLLYRYTRQKEMIVGVPITSRDQSILDNQIGFYVNTLPLWLEMNPTQSFAELVAHIKKYTLEAFQYKAYPFDKLVDELKVPRNLGRSPLFDIMLDYRESDADRANQLELPGLSVKYCPLPVEISHFDLSFIFDETEEGLELGVEFNLALFNESWVERLLQQLKKLVEVATATPDISIDTLEFVPKEELTLMLETFNAEVLEDPELRPVVEWFEEGVLQYPNELALVAGEVRLSYQELNAYSNQMAHRLINEYGIKPGDRVGLFAERDALIIVAMWGILKAGATYVAMDVEFPLNRVRYIVEDSEVKLLIANSTAEVHFTGEVQGMFVRDLFAELAPFSTENPNIPIDLEDLAYIMYTSGTTGKPKGVPIQHFGMSDYARLCWGLFGIGKADIVLATASISFDTSVEEIFPVLCKGGKLVVASMGGKDFQQVIDLTNREKVSILSIAPTLLNELNLHPDPLSSLRLIISAGEALNPAYITSIIEDCDIYNVYGPTEVTISASYHLVENIDEAALIGYPLPNRTIYILDENLRILPLGAVGEIVIGGETVSKGYLNREELTREKFIPNTFEKEGLLYRSGDLGKWQEDGRIEFLGRIDNQVNLRGYRIELDGVEDTLLKQELIRDVVVTVYEQPGSDPTLAAYLIADEGLDISAVRSVLGKDLPRYMIPDHFVLMEEFPLNFSGKVDTKALPAPQSVWKRDASALKAPTTPIELSLAEAFKEVLELEEIGVEENFFDLGGNSLKVIKVFRMLEPQFPKQLSITDLFNYGTIDELASIIASRGEVEAPEEADFEEFEL